MKNGIEIPGFVRNAMPGEVARYQISDWQSSNRAVNFQQSFRIEFQNIQYHESNLFNF